MREMMGPRRGIPAVVTLFALCGLVPQALGCPMGGGCDCQEDQTGVKIIYCKGKGLTAIPVITPSNVIYDELTLADNSISFIPAFAFQGLVVKKIDIQGNPIANISERAFSGVEQTLETLILHGDQGKVVLPGPWDILQNLTALRQLHLSYFDIGSITDPSALGTLTNLQTLAITFSQLHTIHQGVLQPLQQSLTKLDLRENAFLSVPTEAIRGLGALTKLYMQVNRISRVQADSFSTNTRLEELDLTQNRISELEPGCFNQITNSLHFLGLSINRLNGSQLMAIKDVTALQQVNMALNPLLSIPAGSFRGLQHMEFLNLGSCQLDRLTIAMFEGLGSAMIRLTLSDNQVQQIEAGVFEQMTTLNALELDNQRVSLKTQLVPGVFRGLGQLRSLDLEHTGFGSPENWEAIRDLSSLTSLTLSNNQIAQIPDFVFTNMAEITTLDLHQNLLTNISQATFYGLRGSLDTLYLQGNQLSTFDHCTFLNFSMLKPNALSLNLNDNPLTCDCSLEWLGEWVQNNRDPFLSPNWKCADGRNFVDLIPEDFGCPENATRPDCADYYTTTTVEPTTTPETVPTTTTMPTTTTTRPNIEILFNITGVSHSTMPLEWKISHPSYVDYYMIEYEDLSTSERKNTGVIYRTTTSFSLDNLKPRTAYEVCLFVYFKTSDPKNENKCLSRSTLKAPTTVTPGSAGLNGEQIAIIAGSVAGGVLLLIIIAVIVFILVRHRQQENVYDEPQEPAPWKRAGKPHEAYDSKRFTKMKKPGTEHHIKEIRHIQGNNNLQRTSAGSYQYLDRDVHMGQMLPPGGHAGLGYNPQNQRANGLDTSDLHHKYYEIATEGTETHI